MDSRREFSYKYSVKIVSFFFQFPDPWPIRMLDCRPSFSRIRVTCRAPESEHSQRCCHRRATDHGGSASRFAIFIAHVIVSLWCALQMTWKGKGGSEMAASDCSSGALTFVSLPLTPPGKHATANFGPDRGDEATSSPSPCVPSSLDHLSHSSHPPTPLLAPPHAHSGLLPSGSNSAGVQFVSEKQRSRILSAYPASFLSRNFSFTSPGGPGSPHPFSQMFSVVGNAIPMSGASSRRGDAVYGEDGRILRKNPGDASYKGDGWTRILKPGDRPGKRLLVLIVLNLAYSATEFLIGLLTRRIGGHLIHNTVRVYANNHCLV